MLTSAAVGSFQCKAARMVSGMKFVVLAALLIATVSARQLAQGTQQASDKCFDVDSVVLGRSGVQYGSGVYPAGVYGRQYDAKKQPIVDILDSKLAKFKKALSASDVPSRGFGRFTADAKLADAYSNNPDIPTLHEVGGKTFLINHFEGPQPSTAYVTELAADDKGKLRIISTAPVDDTAADVQGMWFMCRGEKTPWGTHIGGEEYPPDCAEYEQVFLPCTNSTGYCGYAESGSGAEGVLQFARYYGYYPGAEKLGQKGAELIGQNLEDFKNKFSCYNYGSSPEISVRSAAGDTLITKWRTIGRSSHETAYTMPDHRTIYTTDDGSNGVLTMFRADKPADLTSGTLFAARLTANGDNNWSVSWIELGKGTQSELQALATNPQTRFSSLFDEAKLTSDGKCPEGYLPANPPSAQFVKTVNGKKLHVQCLKIKAGKENVAAFLETQRVAALKGATTEFEKLEGFAYDPATNTAYIAITNVDKAMLKGSPYDGLGPDTLQLTPNPCGVVMSLKLNDKFEATSAQVFLAGNNKTNTDFQNKCDINSISSPDNLFVANGNLIIAEDTTYHFNNYLWAYNFNTGVLSRILSAPTGAEVSGPSIQHSGGRGYLTYALQHPQDFPGDKTPSDAQEEEAMRAYVGYIGPFSAEALAGKLDFAPGAIQPPNALGQKVTITATNQVCQA